jgi:hypothetical protein
MRPKNQRFMVTGSVLIIAAIGFFLFFLGISGKSTNPAELMRTVGTVSGVVVGLGVALVVAGAMGVRPK